MRISVAQILGCSIIAAALLLGGCAATQIINQWSDPSYAAASFKRIMVIGVSKQSSIRRTFEDEFVAQLRAAGTDAVPGYEFIPEDGQVEESRLAQAVKRGRRCRDHYPPGAGRKPNTFPELHGPYPGFGHIGGTSARVGFYEPPRPLLRYLYFKRACTTFAMIGWFGAASPRRRSSMISAARFRNLSTSSSQRCAKEISRKAMSG
jgi:hypothetical protein